MRPIFIGGCPRSGTTLLGALLGAHSRCVCVPEMPFKFKLLHGIDWDGGNATRKDVRRLIAHLGSFRTWGITVDDSIDSSDPKQETRLAYSEVIEDFVRQYACMVEQAEADVWVEHAPMNIRNTQTLFKHFPDAVQIHLVRDGRGVAASMLKLAWGAHTELSAARMWAEHLAYGFAAEQSSPDRVVRVHFEELLRDPRGVLARLCRFAGLELEDQLGLETRFRIPQGTYWQHSLVAQPPDPGRADSWRTTLSSRQIEIFENRAAELLTYLGYELMFNGQATPPRKRDTIRIELRDFVFEAKRLGVDGYLAAKHRLRLGRPDAP